MLHGKLLNIMQKELAKTSILGFRQYYFPFNFLTHPVDFIPHN